MARTVPAHFKPFPELAERRSNAKPFWIVDTTGKPWLPTNGMTSLVHRKLFVPLQPWARSVARHELAHVKWSPKRLPKKLGHDARILMAVEDARLNLGMLAVGLPVFLSESERVQVGRLAREDLRGPDVLAFVLRAVAALGTNAERAILEALIGESEALRDLTYRHVRNVRVRLLRGRRARKKPVASFQLVRRIARELAEELQRDLAALGYPLSLPWPMDLAGAGCCLGGGHAHAAGRKAGHTGTDGGAELVSGAMTVVQAPLPVPCAAARRSRRARGRATSEGSLPRVFHRWPVDQAVFVRRGRQRGGTVLVDTSGSMALDAAGIDRILEASSGAAIVAIYSGHEREGELRLVARDGKRADAAALVPKGRGNIVDEPALAWLVRQQEPRLWISDGGVTGIGDVTSPELQRRCAELCRRGRITRVRTVEEAAQRLGRRHFQRSPTPTKSTGT